MKCFSCGTSFNDGVQCASCKKQFDFGCAHISEAGWRKLGSERRSTWKCATCKYPSSPTTGEPASLDIVLKELRDLKSQLGGLPSLIEDVKAIKVELKDITTSCDYMGSRLDDFATKISTIEARVASVEKAKESLTLMEKEVGAIKSQINSYEQRSRLNNVEIKGIPVKHGENLFNIVDSIGKAINYSVPRSQINYLHRIPLYGSKEKAIVVSFINRYVKEEFVASARSCKSLAAADIGFTGTTHRVFVNDHLNADSKALLTKTKSRAKDKNYNYVWVKFGKIHIRKNDTSPVFIVQKESDLNKID